MNILMAGLEQEKFYMQLLELGASSEVLTLHLVTKVCLQNKYNAYCNISTQ